MKAASLFKGIMKVTAFHYESSHLMPKGWNIEYNENNIKLMLKLNHIDIFMTCTMHPDTFTLMILKS
ncbi:hypothetical protein SRABI106_00049 [Rahnella aquatilis]|nr:hypothetical protein SRABI106_00049 [Rahnella aquatilis]